MRAHVCVFVVIYDYYFFGIYNEELVAKCDVQRQKLPNEFNNKSCITEEPVANTAHAHFQVMGFLVRLHVQPPLNNHVAF